MEILEKRHIHLPVAWGTLRAIASRTERIRSGSAIGADSIINSSPLAWRYRSIGAPPVLNGAMRDDHWAVLIGATEAPSGVVGVAIVRAKNCHWEPGIEDSAGGESPASKRGIHKAFRVPAVSPAASEGEIVHTYEVHAVADVEGGRAPVGHQVVTILDREPVPAIVGLGTNRVVTRRVRQGFCPSVVEGIFQATVSSLAYRELAGAVVHSAFGLGNQDRSTFSDAVRVLVVDTLASDEAIAPPWTRNQSRAGAPT